MTSEQGVLTVIGELRTVVADLQEQNKDLQAKLDSLEQEKKSQKAVMVPRASEPIDILKANR